MRCMFTGSVLLCGLNAISLQQFTPRIYFNQRATTAKCFSAYHTHPP